MISKSVEIYTLSCPITGEVRYVGKANNSKKRFKSHLFDSTRRHTPVYLWIRELHAKSLQPVMAIIETTDVENWKQREKYHISKFREDNNLLNVAAGGNEPFCSLATRAQNGRKVAKAIHEDIRSKKLWSIKRQIKGDLHFFKKRGLTEAYNRIAQKCNSLSSRFPALFSNLKTELL